MHYYSVSDITQIARTGSLILAGDYLLLVFHLRVVTERNLEIRNNEIAKGLRKKAAAVVLTDFLCWVPICIIGYVHLSGEL